MVYLNRLVSFRRSDTRVFEVVRAGGGWERHCGPDRHTNDPLLRLRRRLSGDRRDLGGRARRRGLWGRDSGVTPHRRR